MLNENPILGAIKAHARKQPDAIALFGSKHAISYAELALAIQQAGAHLRSSHARAIALALDNSPTWAILDLAALDAAKPIVPLPFFFSDGQVEHAIRDAGVDCIFTDQPEYYERILATAGIPIHVRLTMNIRNHEFAELHLKSIPASTLPHGTVKVTYTSGTTGQPKGVCLGTEALSKVSKSLMDASGARPSDRHLSVLPLATLLENIGGIYVPLLTGASCTLLPLAEVGLNRATGLNVSTMLAALSECNASTAILTPEMLHGLVSAIESGQSVPTRLRFIAVGGASVAPRLLQRAQIIGLPVFEGYGLSECASVVALNTLDTKRQGSVGKPLPHVRLGFLADGEILVGGATLLGYTSDDPASNTSGYWPTGDIGHLDEQGFLHITGRKKNIFITSFGRNVSPEWVERELTLHPAIAQAAVFGEARPWNVAVIAAKGASVDVDQAIAEANRLLPDYAQIRQWIPAEAPFTPQNGQLTPNGRLRREAVWATYQASINQLYEEMTDDVL